MTEFYGDAAVLSVRPNWKNGIQTQWSFKTDIFTAREGQEFRRALREKPRYEIDFSIMVARENGVSLRNFFARRHGNLSIVADFSRTLGLPQTSDSVGSIAFDVIPYWIRTGEPIAVITNDVTQVREIASTIDNILTFDAPVDVNHTTKIAPALFVRARENLSITKFTTTTGEARLVLAQDPTSAINPVDPLVGENVPLHRDIPVLPFKPNWANPVKETYAHRADVLDYSYGASFTLDLERDARWSGDLVCLGRTPEETAAAVDFFFRRKGRRGSFYCPTHQRDFTVLSGMSEGSEELHVAGPETFDLVNDGLIYRNLAFIRRDAMVLIGIRSATLDVGGNTILALDSPLPTAIEQTAFVSWLLMCRFSTDDFEVSWKTDKVAEYDINVTSLFDAFFELTIDGHRITFDGDYLTISPIPTEPLIVSFTIDGEHLIFEGDYLGV